MRNLIFVITITSIYIFSSCRECKNIDYCPLPVSAEEYFGAYTEGAYWIYYNGDSTIVDSVYITDYEMKREVDRMGDCIEWDTKTFLLHSEFLSHIPVESKITNGGYCNKGSLRFQINSNNLLCPRFDNEKSLFETCNLTHQVEIIDTFKLNGNQLKYNVLSYNDRHWFAPQIGLIKYLGYNNIDTFYLHQYNVL